MEKRCTYNPTNRKLCKKKYILNFSANPILERMVYHMSDINKPTNNTRNDYDDGNIPDVDLPSGEDNVEPLPESSRPRKDGPGGDGDD